MISQGKVEEILASKPEERRALIEDAAGLGKFKRAPAPRRAEARAGRRSRSNAPATSRPRCKARLRPLALQATAAERAEKLRGEIAGLRARLAELDLAGIDERLAEVEERRAAAGLERKHTGERLEALLAERNRVEEELAAAAGRGDGATSALYRLRSAVERLELRRDAARELCDRLRAEPLLPRTRANPEREALQEQARLATRAAGRARALARRARRAAAGGAGARGGRRAAGVVAARGRGRLRTGGGRGAGQACRRARRRRRGRRAGSRRAGTQGRARRSRRARAAAWGERPSRPPLVGAEPLSSRVRALPGGERVAELLADVWLAEPAELERAESGVLVTREGHCFDAERGELWFAGETAEAVLLQLDARRRALAAEAEELERRAEELPAEAPPVPTGPLVALGERLATVLQEAATTAEHFEAPLRARVDAGATRAGELAAELREARRRGGRGQARRRRGRRAGRRDRRRARTPRGRSGRGAAAAGGGRSRARRGRRPRRARREDRAARAPPRDARAGQPAGQGGVRPREGASDRAGRAASRPRGEPEGARAAARRAGRDGRAPLRRDVHRRQRALRRGRRDALPGRRGPAAADRARGGRRGAGRRGRAEAARQARDQALAALGRREGARRDLVPVRALPRPAVPVLPARRSRGRARRRQHRPLRRAAAPLLRERAVHRRHAPEEDDGGRRRALRRDDGRRRRLADRLTAPAARRRPRLRPRSALPPGVVRAADRRAVGRGSRPLRDRRRSWPPPTRPTTPRPLAGERVGSLAVDAALEGSLLRRRRRRLGARRAAAARLRGDEHRPRRRNREDARALAGGAGPLRPRLAATAAPVFAARAASAACSSSRTASLRVQTSPTGSSPGCATTSTTRHRS